MSERIESTETGNDLMEGLIEDAWLDNGPDYDESDFEYSTQASRAGTDHAGMYGTIEAAVAFEDLYNNTLLDSYADAE